MVWSGGWTVCNTSINKDMKKILLIIFTILSFAARCQVTVDYNDPTITSGWTVGTDNNIRNEGQCFHVSIPVVLTSASMKLRYSGGTNSNPIQYAIFSTTGTFGSTCTGTGSPNSPLAVSSTVPLSTLTSNYTFQTVNLTFTGANSITLPIGNYLLALLWDYTSTQSPSPGGTTASSHAGNRAYYQTNVTTWQGTTGDLSFYVYGDLVSTSSPQVLIWSPF